jgi:hypothetical protein
MCIPTEAVNDLHAVTTALKETQLQRDTWLGDYDKHDGSASKDAGCIPLNLTRAEAELIFANRIAAHEAKLKDLGWSRITRVEPGQGARPTLDNVLQGT